MRRTRILLVAALIVTLTSVTRAEEFIGRVLSKDKPLPASAERAPLPAADRPSGSTLLLASGSVDSSLTVAAAQPIPVGPASEPSVSTLTLASGDALAAPETARTEPAKAAPAAAPAGKGPPLPLHTIEGVGGLVITPMAYLVNPGPKGTVAGLPSTSFTYVGAGQKNIQALAVSETLFERIELSYAVSRFGLGTLGDSVKDATGLDIGRTDVLLHHFNVRGLLLEENSFNLPLPAITAGVHFKINDGIASIDKRLFGTLSGKGLDSDTGIDYTLTATKTFPKVFGRPLITSAGIRFSKAAQIGYLGFGENYEPSFEGNVTYLIADNIALAYEFRQKINQVDRIGKLVRPEDNWQTIGIGWVINNHASLTVGYGRFGNVLDTVENAGWAIQFKYEW
jgi:hypothetical protein